MAKFLAGLLVYIFPKEVVAKILVRLLRKGASLTKTKVDDELVDVIDKKEPKDE